MARKKKMRNNISTCTCCWSERPAENVHPISNLKSAAICDSCIAKNDYVKVCQVCKEYYDSRRHCACQVKKVIYDYNEKTHYKPVYLSATDKSRTFGIEVETERPNSLEMGNARSGNTEDLKKTMSDVEKKALVENKEIIFMKRDGSLNWGIEIITHPLSYAFLLEKGDALFASIFDPFVRSGYRSKATTTCGFHVHADKRNIDNEQLLNILVFFHYNLDLVAEISMRDVHSFMQFAKPTIEPGKESNEINIKLLQNQAQAKFSGETHHWLINLNNPETLEVRSFRGTLDSTEMLRNIEFVAAGIDYSMSKTPDFLVSHARRELFIEFIDARKDIYPHLYSFYHDNLKLELINHVRNNI
jgi:hypothetical protein